MLETYINDRYHSRLFVRVGHENTHAAKIIKDLLKDRKPLIFNVIFQC